MARRKQPIEKALEAQAQAQAQAPAPAQPQLTLAELNAEVIKLRAALTSVANADVQRAANINAFLNPPRS